MPWPGSNPRIDPSRIVSQTSTAFDVKLNDLQALSRGDVGFELAK
jgi:hypothetical protein